MHAGADEHSQILFLRPDLVAEGYRQATSVIDSNFEDLYRIAAGDGGPGYFGAPRLASSAMGASRVPTAIAEVDRDDPADSGRP